MKNAVFWDVKPCDSFKDRCFLQEADGVKSQKMEFFNKRKFGKC
jgi:hypothetical protein